MITDVLRNFNLFVDGRGYAGKVEEATLPKLAIKSDEMRAGGMDAPQQLDMGMEKLDGDFSLAGYDAAAIALWGLAIGKTVQITLRGAVASEDGTVKAVVANFTTRIMSVEPGAWKPGEKGTMKFSHAPTYYKLTVDGVVVVEIDIENMKRIVGGEDQLAAIRSAIGL